MENGERAPRRPSDDGRGLLSFSTFSWVSARWVEELHSWRATGGGIIPLPLSALTSWMFPNYFAPGAILFIILGLGSLSVVHLTWRRHWVAPWLAIAVRGALLIWLFVEIAVGYPNEPPLQALYLALGGDRLAASGERSHSSADTVMRGEPVVRHREHDPNSRSSRRITLDSRWALGRFFASVAATALTQPFKLFERCCQHLVQLKNRLPRDTAATAGFPSIAPSSTRQATTTLSRPDRSLRSSKPSGSEDYRLPHSLVIGSRCPTMTVLFMPARGCVKCAIVIDRAD